MSEQGPTPKLHLIPPDGQLPHGGAEEVGNKAFNLMRMAVAGLPVPPGFVLPVDWCALSRTAETAGAALRETLATGIARVEAATDLRFGSIRRPLLVSVRSGAAQSMPGMMETVLDIGLNTETVDGLIRLTGNPRLAWDSYRRLIQGYAEVVEGLALAPFDELVRNALAVSDAESERALDHVQLRTLAVRMLDRYRELAGHAFPTDPHTQLAQAAEAVFRSWDAPKARSYRAMNGLRDDAGTAVTVQAMVYGNAGGRSGAGVGFTRNPASGERELYFDFQFNSQGEDIVAGRQVLRDNDRLKRMLPAVWTELHAVCHELETLFGDAQDFEFTVQFGELYLLQTRRAKRTPWAAIRIAVDLVAEGLSQPADALATLAGIDLEHVARTHFVPPVPAPIAYAQAAGIGVACGAIALDADAAQRMAARGEKVILVRQETSTADIDGMAVADGIVSGTGGRTSHAAVVARQLAKVCLVSCPGLTVDFIGRALRIGGHVLTEGDFLSIDANEGAIYPGRLAVVTERPERDLAVIRGWQVSTEATGPGSQTDDRKIVETAR